MLLLWALCHKPLVCRTVDPHQQSWQRLWAGPGQHQSSTSPSPAGSWHSTGRSSGVSCSYSGPEHRFCRTCIGSHWWCLHYSHGAFPIQHLSSWRWPGGQPHTQPVLGSCRFCVCAFTSLLTFICGPRSIVSVFSCIYPSNPRAVGNLSSWHTHGPSGEESKALCLLVSAPILNKRPFHSLFSDTFSPFLGFWLVTLLFKISLKHHAETLPRILRTRGSENTRARWASLRHKLQRWWLELNVNNSTVC